jgi:hypothetical protein
LVVLRIGACRFPIKRCHQRVVTESFPLHAPACLLVLIAAPNLTATVGTSAIAAWLHPLLRLGYIGAYIGPPEKGKSTAAQLVSAIETR